ncbi:flagellar biosynthesis protein FliP [Helicobacter bilis]|uniref:Flagellar biosynthetic protein FliP n=2 Tax=Helicobacter bilis TaxID=37372 RepID=A0A6D2CD50_9HELI|nr:flagellar biosynthetic protein FliP [Helicobacter bilis WiWa]TLE05548.1 flagellar biosynthesis protein FliP [Helicobacter bilis]TLE06508.1 flagellar biosynthesis protein FliP [Helicobacter bilis]
MKVSKILKSCFFIFIFIGFIDTALAAPADNQLKLNGVPIPSVDLSINPPSTPTQLVTTLNIVILLTLLILAPSLVLMMTSFTRILIVLGFLRTALGTQQSPPTQVLVSLAMILTFFIMEPVIKDAYNVGIKPYMEEKIGYEEAFEETMRPFKKFMLMNTRHSDIALFYKIRNEEPPQMDNITTKEQFEALIDKVSLSIILPSFMISELKTAFQIGFLLYLPFLVIDMVIASVLMAMGMMMLPPVMISLPFKILIFVLVDGFNLLIWNLVRSFNYS